jgi:hypothetical protein
MLAPLRSWKQLGCDDLTSLELLWLGSPIVHACYAKGSGQDQHAVAALYYTIDWRLAHFDLTAY